MKSMVTGTKLSVKSKEAIKKLKNLKKTPLVMGPLIATLMGFSLFSCGLGDDAPQDAGVYDLGNLNGGCELNTDNLHDILTADVSKDIDCLKANLDQFVQFVRREDANFIGRQELNRFTDKFFPESQEIVSNLLKLVYDINTLLLKDPKDKISVKNLDRFFKLFYIVNNEGKTLNNVLKGLSKENYWARRMEIFQNVEGLAREVLRTIITGDNSDPELEIISFIEELKEILKLNDDQLNIDKIKSFLFAKKLILGGEKTTLKHSEIVNLLDRSSDLVLLGMDVLFVASKEFPNSMEEYYFYYDVVNELKGHFAPHGDTDLIMEHEDLLVILDEVLPDKFNAREMDKAILTVKEKFFGGAADHYVMRDIMNIFNWAQEFAGMLYFNEITYDHYQSEMSSPKAINGLTLPKIESYHVFPSWMIKKLWENFDYISGNYRFYQDDDGKSHFFNYYKRFKKGFQTASMLRWAITKVVQVYGHYPPGKRRKEADEADFKKLLIDLEGVVRQLGMWPDELDKFVSEAIASADLFMYHSDGNESVSAEEFTEYAVNAIHAFSIGDKVHTNLQAYCDIVDQETEAFTVQCFREYFLHVFFKELKYEKYYNKLYEYLNLSGVDELQKYLINIELYSRVDPNTSIPLSKEDLNRIMVIMTNLESAYLRFDIDKDGILNRGELDLAFLVFKNLVIKVAGLGNSGDGLYKSIFLYLVKHMEVPSPLKLVWFHVFGKKKNITSSRYNISAILKNFTVE